MPICVRRVRHRRGARDRRRRHRPAHAAAAQSRGLIAPNQRLTRQTFSGVGSLSGTGSRNAGGLPAFKQRLQGIGGHLPLRRRRIEPFAGDDVARADAAQTPLGLLR